jgi:hypothetical protein
MTAVLDFTSRRNGQAWLQRYHHGLPQGPATRAGRADTNGTVIEFVTEAPIDVADRRRVYAAPRAFTSMPQQSVSTSLSAEKSCR